MRKIIVVTFAFVLFSLSVLAGTGKIQFENTHIYIGKIEQGKVAKAEFKFKNIGDGLLVITKVKPG